jgi:hypothetical protein
MDKKFYNICPLCLKRVVLLLTFFPSLDPFLLAEDDSGNEANQEEEGQHRPGYRAACGKCRGATSFSRKTLDRQTFGSHNVQCLIQDRLVIPDANQK